MAANSYEKLKFLPPASIVISFIIHALILKMLVIQFTLAPEPFKPNLVFLGPILNKHEFQIITKNTSEPHQMGSLNYYGQNRSSRHFEDILLNKPMPIRINKQNQEKTTLKSTFFKKENSTKQGPSREYLGIDLKSTTYKPLRLKNND